MPGVGPHVILAFSNITVTSSGTQNSEPIHILSEWHLRGMHWVLSNATTDTSVSCTASYLVTASTDQTFVLPVDSAGAAMNALRVNINSNNTYVAFRGDDVPYAPLAQLRLKSSTANTVTFAGVYLVYDVGV